MPSASDRSHGAKGGTHETADPLIGRVIDGRFTLLSRIGRGGMGLVYRAQQAPLERAVALKILVGSGEPEREAEFQRRFFREAATAAKLKHPNTITVFDYGSDVVDGQRYFYIAMELLEGSTLSRALARGPLPPIRAVSIALQMCRALREAHRAGVVHRDLKPGNVMLIRQEDADDSERDFVKVLDFGLAKSFQGPGPAELGLTRAGTFLGSPRYVAPEQVEGRPVDPRTDIYAFGCVLYRMLTGRVPFDGDTPIAIMMRHLDTPPPPLAMPGVPPRLEQLVLDCLAKQPAARPVAMDVVIARLKAIRAELAERSSGPFSEESDIIEGIPLDASDVTPPSVPRLPASLVPQPVELGPPPPLPPAPLEVPLELRLGVVLEEATRPTTVLHTGGTRRAVAGLIGMLLVLGALVGIGLWGREAGWLSWLPGVGGEASQEAHAETSAPWTGRAAEDGKPGSMRTVSLQIRSEPSGAEVVEATEWGSQPLGTTPLSLSWKTHPAGPARRFVLSAPGYAPAKAVATPPPAEAKPPYVMELHVALERVEASSAKGKKR